MEACHEVGHTRRHVTTVCVIGAGIVGCATAYQLARYGVDVHLIDAAPEPGAMTSFANGAQLSYSYVEPFASPATLRALPHLLLSTDSPVRIHPHADWQQWVWAWKFLKSCRPVRARAATAHLLRLAQLSRRTLDEWMLDEFWSFDFARNGKLVLCGDLKTLRHQERQVALQASLGCVQQVLTREECLRYEPALRLGRAPFVGGIWTASECVADPRQLCEQLVCSLHKRGGRASFETRVTAFARDGRRFIAARTTRGEIGADAFVLAAGPQAAGLASMFGLRLPLYPIKGYSITVPLVDRARPVVSVTDLGAKTVFAPLGNQMRVAAMAEVGAFDLTVPEARVRRMVESLQALYPGVCDVRNPKAWAGLRPATPDSVPIVGRWETTNMFLNAGHGALGLTLAAGTAAQICASVLQWCDKPRRAAASSTEAINQH